MMPLIAETLILTAIFYAIGVGIEFFPILLQLPVGCEKVVVADASAELLGRRGHADERLRVRSSLVGNKANEQAEDEQAAHARHVGIMLDS